MLCLIVNYAQRSEWVTASILCIKKKLSWSESVTKAADVGAGALGGGEYVYSGMQAACGPVISYTSLIISYKRASFQSNRSYCHLLLKKSNLPVIQVVWRTTNPRGRDKTVPGGHDYRTLSRTHFHPGGRACNWNMTNCMSYMCTRWPWRPKLMYSDIGHLSKHLNQTDK